MQKHVIQKQVTPDVTLYSLIDYERDGLSAKGRTNLNDISTFLMSSTSFHFLYFFKGAEINLKNANFTLKLC